MTTFVLPCGTSVLDNISAGRGCTREPEAVEHLGLWAHGIAIHTTQPAEWEHGARQRLDRAMELVQGVDPGQISAERSSIHQHQRMLSDADHVVLLASDTAEGVLAALVNAYLLRGPVKFWTYPPAHPWRNMSPVGGAVGGPIIDIVRIAGLRPQDATEFAGAMEHAASVLRWALRDGNGMVLMLTGGYKASVPYLTVLAEYAKAIDTAGVRAFCLHEGDRSTEPPPPIEIFLRTVHPDADRAELDAVFDNGKGPADGRLRSFAYNCDPGTNRDVLTGLGRAIKAFVDG